MGEDEIRKNEKLVFKLIEKNFSEPRKKLVMDMLRSPTGEEYFLAPASSKVSFHDCFVGGLCYHSLNVLQNLRKLADVMAPGEFSDETLIFVSLFHDLGKVGDGVEPYYVPNPSDWHREKLGKLYEINQKCVMMPTSERGLYLLQRHGIPVTADEYLAVRLNDGAYPPENKPYSMHEPRLALLLHWADRWDAGAEKI